MDDDHVFDLPPKAPPPLPRTGNERRVWTRAPYLTPGSLLAGEKHIEARTLDVSEGGVLLLARAPLAMGAEAIVRFAPPLSIEPVSLHCIVRWTGTPGRAHSVGVSFLAIPEPVRAAIAAYAALVRVT